MADSKVPYIRFPIGWHDTDKAITMGLRGRAVWMAYLDFCGMYLTDGVVTRAQMTRVTKMADADIEDADRLVEQGYLVLIDGKYTMPGFADENRTSEDVERLRARRAAAGSAGGLAKAANAKARKGAPSNPVATASKPLANSSPLASVHCGRGGGGKSNTDPHAALSLVPLAAPNGRVPAAAGAVT